MFANHDDDDLFNPTATSSNLASLFNAPRSGFKQSHDASLTYTAPKQPKPLQVEAMAKTASKPKSPSTVICSKFVDVFKLVDKERIPQGKSGLAIIGNEAANTYEIIIYKTKQDIIMRSKLNSNFSCTFRHCSASMCDDLKQNWSVVFEKANELNEFMEKIEARGGIVLHDSNNNKSESCAEDKIKTSLPTFKDSDSDHSSSQTRADILLRMSKMGQAILPNKNLPATQSSDISDSEPDTQANRKTVKKRRDQASAETVKQMATVQTPPEFVMVNGQLIPASILSQASFPNQFNLQNASSSHIVMNQPQLSDSLHVFIAENRTHNCELRMNISQLSFKLDQVLSKIEDNPNKSKERFSCKETIVKIQELEDKIFKDERLVANLKDENEAQKNAIFEQELKIKELKRLNIELNEKIAQYEENASKSKEEYESEGKARGEVFDKKLKQLMNSLYHQIVENFQDESVSFPSVDIKRIVSQNIKAGTLMMIQEFQKDFVSQEVDLNFETSK